MSSTVEHGDVNFESKKKLKKVRISKVKGLTKTKKLQKTVKKKLKSATHSHSQTDAGSCSDEIDEPSAIYEGCSTTSLISTSHPQQGPSCCSDGDDVEDDVDCGEDRDVVVDEDDMVDGGGGDGVDGVDDDDVEGVDDSDGVARPRKLSRESRKGSKARKKLRDSIGSRRAKKKRGSASSKRSSGLIYSHSSFVSSQREDVPYQAKAKQEAAAAEDDDYFYGKGMATTRPTRRSHRSMSKSEHQEEHQKGGEGTRTPARTGKTHRRPPRWEDIPQEKAIRHYLDVHQNVWRKEDILIQIEPRPFSGGSLRKAYYARVTVVDEDAQEAFHQQYGSIQVLKVSIDPDEHQSMYYQDVEMQMYAAEWAEEFNRYSPPKPVKFIPACCVELTQRSTRPTYALERFVDGPYRKHNNNFGYVSEDERNTPQAFSHFTYVASGREVLLIDVQGVNDVYTDPQIHTSSGIGCGHGNLGMFGMNQFISTHECNAICKYLRLPPVNSKVVDMGTRPQGPTRIPSHSISVLHKPLPTAARPYSYVMSPSPGAADAQEWCCTLY